MRVGHTEALPRSQAMANFLDEISKIPADKPAPDDGLVGSVDHDKILYGNAKGAA